jgi:hypothetical protein
VQKSEAAICREGSGGKELCEKSLKVKREENILSLSPSIPSICVQKLRTQTVAPIRDYFWEDSNTEPLLMVGTKTEVLSKSHYKKEAVNRNLFLPSLKTSRDFHGKENNSSNRITSSSRVITRSSSSVIHNSMPGMI